MEEEVKQTKVEKQIRSSFNIKGENESLSTEIIRPPKLEKPEPEPIEKSEK